MLNSVYNSTHILDPYCQQRTSLKLKVYVYFHCFMHQLLVVINFRQFSDRPLSSCRIAGTYATYSPPPPSLQQALETCRVM